MLNHQIHSSTVQFWILFFTHILSSFIVCCKYHFAFSLIVHVHSVHKTYSIIRFILSLYYLLSSHHTFFHSISLLNFILIVYVFLQFICLFVVRFFNRGAKKDPYSNSAERKIPIKKYHSMKSPKYLVSHKNQNNQPQHRLASQMGKS